MKEYDQSQARMAIRSAYEMSKVLVAHESELGENSLIWKKIQHAIMGRMDVFAVSKIWCPGQVTFQHPYRPNEQLSFFLYSKDHGQIIVDWRKIERVDSKTKVLSCWGLEPFSWKGKPRVSLSREIFASTSDADYSLEQIAPNGPLDAENILVEENASIFDEPTVTLGLEWKNGVKYRMLRIPVSEALQRFPIPD